SGAIKDLEAYQLANKRLSEQSDPSIPAEFRAVGGSTQKRPGMIVFPGTETRYTMALGGAPQLAPIYVPEVNIRYVDGQATVTKANQSQARHFVKPEDEAINSYLELAAGETFVFTRFISVSDADWGPIARDAYTVKGVPTAALAGAVVEAGTGNHLPGAVVRISGGPGWDGNG